MSAAGLEPAWMLEVGVEPTIPKSAVYAIPRLQLLTDLRETFIGNLTTLGAATAGT